MMNMKQKIIASLITIIILTSIILVIKINKMDTAKANLKTIENSYKKNIINLCKNDREKKYEDVLITIKSDKERYSWFSDTVKLKLKVENQGNRDIKLNFSTSQQHDFIIKNQLGMTIFRWSENYGFAQVFTELELSPGQNKSWNYSWKQKGHILSFMPYHKMLPGSYTIVGNIPTIENNYKKVIQIKTGIFTKTKYTPR